MSPDAVADHFGSDPFRGLESTQIKKNRKFVHLARDQSALSRVLIIIFHQFINPIEYVLIISAVVAWGIDRRRDSYFIIGVLIFNAIIGFIQEYRTEKIVRALKDIVPKKIKVVREGSIVEILTNHLVPGDVVMISAGDRVPADLRISYSQELELDESQLTGESELEKKSAKTINLPGNASVAQKNIAFFGSLVMQGHGRGIVVACGRDVRFSKTLARATQKKDAPSPLELEVKKIALAIILFAGSASIITFIIALFRNLSVQESLIYVISLFVAIVPEGLPIVVTIVLTVAAYRMAKSKVLTRKLASADMLGNVDIVLTDKTGTITTGDMTVRNIWQNNSMLSSVISKNTIKLYDQDENRINENNIEETILAGALANNAQITYHLKSAKKSGDAVDIALLEFARKLSCCRAKIMKWKRVAEISFSSQRRFMAVLGNMRGNNVVYVKGAPEVITSRSKVIALDGKRVQIDQETKDKLNSTYKSLAREGMKVIALAKKDVQSHKNELSETDIRDLTFLGIVGIEDAPRPDIAETIKNLEEAGIEVKLVTGDHSSTAYSIAKDVGIAGRVITGKKLSGLIAAHRGDVLQEVKVFARMSPENKLDLVHYYQKRGLQVAMSGDGVNDAAAIKAANVGIAFAGEGGEVAAQTADVVLTDSNFNTLAQGLHEGRTVWQNLRKIIYFLFSTNIAELIVITVSLLAALPMPFSAMQILWINLVTDTLSDEALAFEPPEGKLYRNHGHSLINNLIIRRVIIAAVWQSIVTLMIYIWAVGRFSAKEATSIAFFTLVIMQVYNLVNSRSLYKSIFSFGPRKNYWMVVAIGATLITLFASVYFRPLADFLRLAAIDLKVMISIMLIGLSIIGVVELDKIIVNNKSNK